MATSAQQATFAAQKGKNWAAPTDAGFGQAGYTDQADYDAYSKANPAPTNSADIASTSSSSFPAAPVTLAGGGATASPAAPSAPPTTTAGVLNSPAPAAGQTPTTVAGAFQNALVSRLSAGPTTAQSASVAPAIEANKLSEQRNFERNRAMLAERAGANGQDTSGGFETGLMGLSQDRAQREGQFAGQAVADQNRADQQQLMSLLGLTSGMLGQEDNRGLQRYGMDQDAAIRREGIGAQTSLGRGDLDLRSRLGNGQLNLGLLTALLGNDQFGRGLAQNGAQFGASLDQNGLLALLSGL